MKKNTIAIVFSMAFLLLSQANAYSKGGGGHGGHGGGRSGSHRVGGYNSHGKGSHYVGGYSSRNQIGGYGDSGSNSQASELANLTQAISKDPNNLNSYYNRGKNSGLGKGNERRHCKVTRMGRNSLTEKSHRRTSLKATSLNDTE